MAYLNIFRLTEWQWCQAVDEGIIARVEVRDGSVVAHLDDGTFRLVLPSSDDSNDVVLVYAGEKLA